MTLELRRFRTWESETPARPRRAWRILLKYGYLRMMKTWYIALLAVVALIFTIVFVGTLSYEMGYRSSYDPGASVDDETLWFALSMFAFPVAGFVLLVGTPLLSEDIRFNAPLFYFSKPLRVRDYLLGKQMQLHSVLALFSIVPLLIVLLMALVIGMPSSEPVDGRGVPLAGLDLERWQHTAIDTFGDWLFASFFLVAGAIAALAFGGTLTLLVSAYTRRAWHAAMALVAILVGWSMLGLGVGDAFDSAYQFAFAPLGWFILMTQTPLDTRFDLAAEPSLWQHPQEFVFATRYLDGAWGAIALGYVFAIGFSVLFYWATFRRLRQTEALL